MERGIRAPTCELRAQFSLSQLKIGCISEEGTRASRVQLCVGFCHKAREAQQSVPSIIFLMEVKTAKWIWRHQWCDKRNHLIATGSLSILQRDGPKKMFVAFGASHSYGCHNHLIISRFDVILSFCDVKVKGRRYEILSSL